MVPHSLLPALTRHLAAVREQHQRDLIAGTGHVHLPDALARKYPAASREWTWQWLFPAARPYTDRITTKYAATTSTRSSSSTLSASPVTPPASPSRQPL